MFAIRLGRQQVGAVHHARQAVRLHLDGSHHVEAENGQIVEVIFAERFRAQVGVQATQAAQATHPLTNPLQRGDFQIPGVPNHDRFDRALAADQQTDLAFDFTREFGEIARQLLGDDAFRWEATTVQMFEAPELPRLQSRGMAVDTRWNSPAFRWRLASRCQP
jgi:hypothetical protein